MIAVLKLGYVGVRAWLRERTTLFWSLFFPVFLLVLLSAIFGGADEERYMRFTIGLINLDQGQHRVSESLEETFMELAREDQEERDRLFVISRPAEGQRPSTFLTEERKALRQGRRAAVVIIPEGFSASISQAVRRPADAPQTQVKVLYSQGNTSSELAASIVEQVLADLDRELLIEAGLYEPTEEIPSEAAWVGTGDRATRYVDFLLPGVVLMAFLTNGLFGVPGSILYARDRHILRQYWVTPVTVRKYLAGFSLSMLGMCVLQLALLWAIGKWAFGARVSLATPQAMLYLVLAAVTFMAVGFLIASFARTANAATSIANILNMPMLFLSGVFFPVTGLPVVLQALVYINPVTHLVDGLRAAVDVGSGQLPLWSTLMVPLAWIVLAVAVAGVRMQWDVD